MIDGLPFNSEGYERAKNILQTKYGQSSEIVAEHVKCIMDLPVVSGSNSGKVRDFYQKLVTHVQALETMGKLRDINGNVRITLDKLSHIRSDLVRMDDNWKEWTFPQLVEALRQWTERNPASEEKREKQHGKHDKNFHAQQKSSQQGKCTYCDSEQHKSNECTAITSIPERKKILSSKKACFNCTGRGHQATKCRSRNCFKCGGRHHSSICDKSTGSSQEPDAAPASEGQLLCSTQSKAVTYPVVIVKINGVKCRALIDTGAGSCYASSTLINRIGIKPKRRESRKVEMLLHTTVRKIDIYDLELTSAVGEFQMTIEVSSVEKQALLHVKNPNYKEMVATYSHLRGVEVVDTDTKDELPIHLILGTSEYTQIKMNTLPRVGQKGEPVAENTRLGWIIMSPGSEVSSNLYLTGSSLDDYDRLCRLDVLGLEDRPEGDQESVYKEFKEQLQHSDEGYYTTGLPWKVNHQTLESNEKGSLCRLSQLCKKLKRNPELFDAYDQKIRDQISEGIVEKAPVQAKEKEFYIPHKAVVRENAESTKLRIVYDASAKPSNNAPSLNDCLEVGPPLQNLLWNVLARCRMRPVATTGDLKQAFLQIRIREEDRDALRFHWIKNRYSTEIAVLRFTRLVF